MIERKPKGQLSMARSNFQEIEIPQQKIYSSVPFPYVVSPSTPNPSLSSFIQSIRAEKPYLESLLHKSSGALLFRGFPVNTAQDFNDVVEAFGYEEFPYTGGAALRRKVLGRVYTANESPLHLKVGLHHELSLFPVSPSKLFFFCEVEPVGGGETPVIPSHVVYKIMKERCPEVVQQLEEQGVIYDKIVPEEDDPTNPIGRGWKSTFGTDDKTVAEERGAKLGIKMDWIEGGAKFSVGPVPAIKQMNKSSDQKIWFNGIFALAYPGYDEDISISFGDGTPLPGGFISDGVDFVEKESVAFPWRKGDVLLIDNLTALHGRFPSNPPRRILASLCR